MEVKRSNRYNFSASAPESLEPTKPTTLTKILLEAIVEFRKLNYKNPSLIRISYEEKVILLDESSDYGRYLGFFTSPMTFYGIPLAVCERPVPRFELNS